MKNIVVCTEFHSTETALLKVQNGILPSLDQSNVTLLVLLDLLVTFDATDHKMLLHHLEHYSDIVCKNSMQIKQN